MTIPSSLPQLAPTRLNWNEQRQTFPPNSEEFYRNADIHEIKARIQSNVSERDTYLNSVNHEMDEIQARTTGNGGVVSAEDKQRLLTLKLQIRDVMGDNTGPESKEFHDKLWFARDRAQKLNPADLDYATMQAADIAPLVKNSRTHQEEYLTDLDAELGDLVSKQHLKTATPADKERAIYLQAQIENVIRANPEAVQFNWELQERLDHFTQLNTQSPP